MKKTIAELKSFIPENGKYVSKCDNNTILFKYPNEDEGIILHSTIIANIHYNHGQFESIQLNSGGYQTPTTKDRMNNILRQLREEKNDNIYFQISQEKRKWYVYRLNNYKWELLGRYQDNMIINHSGNIVYTSPIQDTSELDKMINSYCKGLKTYLDNNGALLPDSGDCFYCQMYTIPDNTPLGDAIQDKDHLITHLIEKYYMGSLNYNALKASGYPHPEIQITLNFTDMIVRSVKKYLRKNLGLIG